MYSASVAVIPWQGAQMNQSETINQPTIYIYIYSYVIHIHIDSSSTFFGVLVCLLDISCDASQTPV